MTEDELLTLQEQLLEKERKLNEILDVLSVTLSRFECQLETIRDNASLRAQVVQVKVKTEASEHLDANGATSPPLFPPRESQSDNSGYATKAAAGSISTLDNNTTIHESVSKNKLIVTELRDSAYTAAEDEHLDNRSKYPLGPRYTVDYYRGKMANVFMEPDEHIVDYIDRVKDLRAAILDCSGTHPDVENIDSLTRESFIQGLIRNLRLEVRCHCRDASLKRVFDQAIEFYDIQAENDKQRYGGSEGEVSFHETLRDNTSEGVAFAFRRDDQRSDYSGEDNRSPFPYDDNRRSAYTSAHGPKPTPQLYRDNEYNRNSPPERYQQYKSGNGYVADHGSGSSRNDYQRDVPRDDNNSRDVYAPSWRNGNRPQPTPRAPTKRCNYCKNAGHDIRECRKREFNNRKKEQKPRIEQRFCGLIQVVPSDGSEPPPLDVPLVKLTCAEFDGELNLLVVTGSDSNVIKISSLNHDVPIDTDSVVDIVDVTQDHVLSYGSATLTIDGTIVEFDVVPDSVRIPADGILGASFFAMGSIISFARSSITWNGKEIPFANP